MTTEQPTEQKKKFPWIPVVGGCCALAVIGVVIALIIGGNIAKKMLENVKNDPQLAAEVFFATLKTDASYAYSLTAADFREVTPEEDLVNYVAETPILRDFTVLNLQQQEPRAGADENLTVLVGTIETDTEYTTLYVETTREEDSAWRVNYFELGFQPTAENDAASGTVEEGTATEDTGIAE